jgi:Xaa-Pro aminopeptidase
MSGNSIAILSSNDVMPNNADDVMGFAQNNDLFYLSGIDQDETVWFFTQMLSKKKTERFCFVKEVNEQSKIWDGDFLTKEEVSTISGVKNVKWTHEMEKTHSFAFEADTFIWDIMSM